MNESIDTFPSIKKGLRVVCLNPILLVFSFIVIIAKILFQFFAQSLLLPQSNFFETTLNSTTFQQMIAAITQEAFLILFIIFLLHLILKSLGLVALIFLSNTYEKSLETKFSWKKIPFNRYQKILHLEIVFFLSLICIGAILNIPAYFATTRQLLDLAQIISLSALGITLAIAILFIFLYNYTAIYLSLSQISLRSAIENSYLLFRKNIKETLLLAIFFIFIRITAITFTTILFRPIASFLQLSSIHETFFSFFLTFFILILIEAWHWATLTIFFRKIALFKEPFSPLQEEKNMVQQKGVVGFDEV